MAGDFSHAKEAANELAEHVGPMLNQMPVAETYVPTPIFVLVRFHRRDEILKLPPPDATLAMTTAFWHFARGSAFAAKGKTELAETERKILESARKETTAGMEFTDLLCGADNQLYEAKEVRRSSKAPASRRNLPA